MATKGRKKNEPGGSYNGTHWSQTPEGRKRMSEVQKKRFASQRRGTAKRAKSATHTERNDVSTTAPELDEAVFAYALGHVESWLGTYAASAGVPATTLASRVGKVLHGKAGR